MTAQPAPSLLAERRRVIIAGICALILTVGMGRFAYTPMLPIMNEQAGLSILAGGWLATLNYAGYMSGVLLAATVGDLQQKYRLYRHGLLLALVSTVGMGLTDNLYLWTALRLLAGISSTAGLLIASGLIVGITPTSIRRRCGQQTLDFALPQPDGAGADEPKAD